MRAHPFGVVVAGAIVAVALYAAGLRGWSEVGAVAGCGLFVAVALRLA